jgi:hypothetical protein
MAAVAWWLRRLFIAVPVLVGALVYAGLVLLLRIVPREDLAMVLGLFKSALGRLRSGRSAAGGGEL